MSALTYKLNKLGDTNKLYRTTLIVDPSDESATPLIEVVLGMSKERERKGVKSRIPTYHRGPLVHPATHCTLPHTVTFHNSLKNQSESLNERVDIQIEELGADDRSAVRLHSNPSVAAFVLRIINLYYAVLARPRIKPVTPCRPHN